MQIVMTLCDRHHAKGEQVEADSTQMLKLNKREGEMDLCVECVEELSAFLEPWFEIGRRPGKIVAPVPANGTKGKAFGVITGHHRQDAIDGRYWCRSDNNTGCTDYRETAQGRSMHERKAHEFHFNGLTDAEQAIAEERAAARAKAALVSA